MWKPGRDMVGSVTLKQIYEIALVKGKDDGFKNTDLKGICKCLIDSAHSMGIQIVNDRSEQGEDVVETATAWWLTTEWDEIAVSVLSL